MGHLRPCKSFDFDSMAISALVLLARASRNSVSRLRGLLRRCADKRTFRSCHKAQQYRGSAYGSQNTRERKGDLPDGVLLATLPLLVHRPIILRRIGVSTL